MKKDTWMSVAVLFGWFAVMYVANAWMPLYRDDYLAGVIWRTGDHLQSMGDILYSLERYYMMHGGRLVSFFIQFVFMFWGKFWFNIANAFVFATMVAVMFLHCTRDTKLTSEPKLLALLGAFAWLGISHFGEIAIWLCGSAVYLWTGLLTAVFLLPYNLALAGNLRRSKWWLAVLMFPLGMVASCSVENLTVTTSLLAVGIAWISWKRKKLSSWMVTGAVGSLIGSVICIAAPGNFVRIVDDEDRSWLFHILNQIPANLEMLLYMTPVLLSLVLAYRLLCRASAVRRGISLPSAGGRGGRHLVLLGFLAVIIVSFFTTGFFALAIQEAVERGILFPIGLSDEVTTSHFENTMAGVEEALIYILGLSYVYLLSVERLGLEKKRIRALRGRISWKQILQDYPQLRYGLFLLGLSIINNLVVMGAPSFPGRALFSSSIMFIIGAGAILRVPEVWEPLFSEPAGKIFRMGGIFVTGFIIVATLTVLHSIWREDAVRVSYIAKKAMEGEQIVTVPPSAIPERRRILRHIAYDDFDKGMTREHICAYFGISTIKLDKNMKLEDLQPHPLP